MLIKPTLIGLVQQAAARPGGMTTADIPGYSREQVGRCANKLLVAGKIYAAKISHKNARYFADESAAKAVQRSATQPTGKANAAMGERLGRQRFVESARLSLARSNRTKVAPVIPDGLEIQRAAPMLDRFAPSADFVGALSKLKPGQYETAPSRWVEAMA